MVLRKLLLIVLPLLLISCGGSESDPPTATAAVVQEQASAVPAATETAEPAETATTAATMDSPTASAATEAAPEAPTAESAAPTAVPAADPVEPVSIGGRGSFEDNFATADRFVLSLQGIEPPPAEQMLVGWLTAADGSFANIGVVKPEADGSFNLSWNSPSSENLISRYHGFQMTVESDGSGAAPVGPVVLAGGLDDASAAAAVRLFVRNDGQPATPLNTALAIGMRGQSDVALQHIRNASNASAIGAQAEMRAHLEHVINILEGSSGSRFGDHDGAGGAQNPGDGFGVNGYINQISQLLPDQPALASAAAAALAQTAAIEDEAIDMLGSTDSSQMSGMLETLKTLADQLQSDGILGMYQAAQQAIGFDITPVE